MTIRLFRDVEEAIAREVRRITSHDDRSTSHTVLKETFDPITGESVSIPIEPDFYDSSADTKNINYPHFFIKLLKTKEDRFTGRVIPQYGYICSTPVKTSSKAYEVVLFSADGDISTAGNILQTGVFQFRKIQPGHLLKILSGPNKGTYTITTATASNLGAHTIEVSNDLVTNLPTSYFDTTTRKLTFTDFVDLNTVKVGDTFEDASVVSWTIDSIDVEENSIVLGGVGTPDVAAAGKISRPGDVFEVDAEYVKFNVLDSTKPLLNSAGEQTYSSYEAVNFPVPLDLYYLVRIDSKEKATHVDIANRVWEEFNPPRTGLPVIIRTKDSFEQRLGADVVSGGSDTINVGDNSGYKVGETVFIFDDLVPTKKVNGDGFQEVFSAKIISKVGADSVVLDAVVPDYYTVDNRTKIVSNARYELYMFHFVDHVTRDVESAQYWSHEFSFWIQGWMDRQGEPILYEDTVQKIAASGEDIVGNIIIEC